MLDTAGTFGKDFEAVAKNLVGRFASWLAENHARRFTVSRYRQRPSTDYWLRKIADEEILDAIRLHGKAAISFFGPLALARADVNELASIAAARKILQMSDKALERRIQEVDRQVEGGMVEHGGEPGTPGEQEIESLVKGMKSASEARGRHIQEFRFIDQNLLTLVNATVKANSGVTCRAIAEVLRKQAEYIVRGAKGG